MKKSFFLFLSLVSITFTACFDITEEITVEKNGNGQYTTIIDATKLAEQMEMFAAFDTTGEMIPRMKYSLDSSFSSTWAGYAAVEGVSNVKIDTSKAYLYKLTLDFKDVKALNDALNKGKAENLQNAYAWEKGKLTRKDVPLNMGDMKEAMGDESQRDMIKGFLKDMKYKVIFNLPSNVKNTSNTAATLSDSKKTVTLDMNMLDIMEEKVKLGTEITY